MSDCPLTQLVTLSESAQAAHRAAVRSGCDDLADDLAVDLQAIGMRVAGLIVKATRDSIAQEQTR